ncbi:MAG: phosphoserine transaminase [Rickettsiales bacterium]
MPSKPTHKPANPNFSSGPCSKRPGWSVSALQNAPVGRSHRAAVGKKKLKEAIDLSRSVLGIPADYRIGVVPASDTGAVEMAMWSMLGARGVDVFAWESFGNDWATDVVKQLKIQDARIFKADYGLLPDLGEYDGAHDAVFAWNGTTSGVRVPNGDWIAENRQGLTICDATSAVFAMALPWEKLDVVTWSWQKAMGGEGAHGMLVLSPRAVQRLETYSPDRPLPKIFRMTKGGKLNEGIFVGETINTPSMLCVEDAIDSMRWMEQNGGAAGMEARSSANLDLVRQWVGKTPWVAFLAEAPETVSSTSVCLKIVDGWYAGLDAESQQNVAKSMVKMLEKEQVAYDVGAYRDAPAGLRVWCGSTVEASDVEKLLPWLDWAFASAKSEYAEKAA